jgi:putative ABC transport system permease protein
MSLNVRPIISALLRAWTGPVLVAAQVAITLAVVVNALYIVKQRIDKIDRPTGMDVHDIFVIRSEGVAENFAHEATIRADLAYLRRQPAVVAVTTMDYAPLGGDGNSIGVMLQPDDQRHGIATGYYEVDEDGIRALGLHLTAGRPFTHNEILPPRTGNASDTSAGQAIITQALADDLYPDGHALGKTLYDSGRHFTSPATIVGIIDHLYGFRVSWGRVDRVILAPRLPYPDDQPIANYVVRTQPGQRDVVMRSVESYLQASNPDRIIDWIRPLDYFKDRSYVADRSMEVFLSGHHADAARRHRSRNFRPGHFQRGRPREADWNATRARCAAIRHSQLFSRRELADYDGRRGRRMRARALGRLLALRALSAAAPGSVLSRQRHSSAMGNWVARSLGSGAACGCGAASRCNSNRLTGAHQCWWADNRRQRRRSRRGGLC